MKLNQITSDAQAEALRIAERHYVGKGWSYSPEDVAVYAARILARMSEFLERGE